MCYLDIRRCALSFVEGQEDFLLILRISFVVVFSSFVLAILDYPSVLVDLKFNISFYFFCVTEGVIQFCGTVTAAREPAGGMCTYLCYIWTSGRCVTVLLLFFFGFLN